MKILFSEYEWKARILVAFLMIVPVIFVTPWLAEQIPWVFPPLLKGTVFIAAFYALMASVVREMGVRAERQLVKSWGGLPSTIVMRWRDTTRSQEWKSVQHEMVLKKLGIHLMNADEERGNSVEADKRIADAFSRIKTSIWGKTSLPSYAGNIDYGFARNLYGCRWIWLILPGLSISTVLAAARVLDKPAPVTEIALEFLCAIGVIIVEWGFMKQHVRHCAFSYAEHAWDALADYPKVI